MAKRNLVSAGLSVALAILTWLSAAAADAGAVTPVKADTFDDSIGVNYFLDTSPQLSYAQASQDLQELGIRHVRSQLQAVMNYSLYDQLNANLGIKFDFALGYYDPSSVPGLVAQFRDNFNPGVIEGLEGVNEPAHSSPVSDVIASQGFAAGAQMVYDMQQALYTTVKNDAVLHNVSVLAPPLYRSANMAQAMASLNIEQYVDYANAHAYPHGNTTSNPQPPEINAAWATSISVARTTAPDRPLLASETNTTGSVICTEPSEGIYAPRLFLANFQAGCVRSYYYSLVNYNNDPFPPLFGTPGQSNLTTPNPEAYAIMHMIGPGGILYEPQPETSLNAQPLDLTLSDVYDPVNNPNGVASQLFEKSDGTYYLALWRPNFYASNANTPDVTLTLANLPAADLTLYSDLDYPSMLITSLLPSTDVNIPVGARVVFTEIVPGLPGDYNNDGRVDAADYGLWRKNPNAYGGDPGGYNTWRANFGRNGSAGAGASLSPVPEPAGWLMAAMICAMLLIGHPRQFHPNELRRSKGTGGCVEGTR